MVLLEQQYKSIRQKLDTMGYNQPCSVESIFLVDKLLQDLQNSTEKQKLYEDVASEALKRCDELENSIEPYKEENAELTKENNKLHLDIIEMKERDEKIIKNLKIQINDIENRYSDLEFAYMEQMANVSALRQELLNKNAKLFNLEGRSNIVEEKYLGESNKPNTIYIRDRELKSDESFKSEENNTKKLQELLSNIEILRNQVKVRDQEIFRLGQHLEKKRALPKFSTERKCSCHNMSSFEHTKTTNNLNEKLKIAQDKQHEAMQRAICLADRIQELEDELTEIQNKYKFSEQCSCGTKIKILQKRYDETLNQSNNLEVRITRLQSCIDELTQENKKSLKEIESLEKERNDLRNKVDNFKIIENDLMSEIDRLQQQSADLRNEIARTVEKKNSIKYSQKMSTENSNLSNANNPQQLKSENEGADGSKITDQESSTSSSFSNKILYEKMKAERDYYCNELHRIQEKLSNEICKCDRRYYMQKERSPDMTQVEKLKNVILQTQTENKRLRDEMSSLRNSIIDISSQKHVDNWLEERLKKIEHDKEILAASNTNLQCKLQSAEQCREKFIKKLEILKMDFDNFRIKYNQLKSMNDHLEMSLKNSEAATKQAEADLNQAISKVRKLEMDLHCAQNKISAIEKERQEAKENLFRIDNEKDQLLLKMDEKTVQISNIERDLRGKTSHITQLEDKNCQLQTQLQTIERMLQVTEEKSREYHKDIRRLEQEIISLESCKEQLIAENKTLKKDLAAVSQDTILANHALELSRKEAEDLKKQLQTYVDEVRRVEKILQEKELERDALLENFNALSAEASYLETNHQSLECEANLTKDNLRDTQQKLHTLQQDFTAKDTLFAKMEHQARLLSDKVTELQAKVSEMSDRELMLSSDLEAARNLCATLEEQKQYYGFQLNKMEMSEKTFREELERLECENQSLQNQLGHEKKNTYALENVLATSRQDAMEKSLFNEDLVHELSTMKETIAALENKLKSITVTLSDCQRACSDYHSQNLQLRRQITDEKFKKAKAEDSNSTSL